MLIDVILDRKEGYGSEYTAMEFYNDAMGYEQFDVARALDSGYECDVKKALCDYIDQNGYNASIKDYINSVRWLIEGDDLNFTFLGKFTLNEIEEVPQLLKLCGNLQSNSEFFLGGNYREYLVSIDENFNVKVQ